MFKCPNKNLPEWKELEKTVPESAYTIWDMNNGYGIDKAPNGEPSKLFLDLLDYYGDRVLAIKAKALIYSSLFTTQESDTNGEPRILSLLSALKGELTTVSGELMLSEIGEFNNSKDVIDYLLKKPIRKQLKLLLSYLRDQLILLVIANGRPKPDAMAWYNGNLNLLEDVIKSETPELLAEDVAHEMLHHYLQKYFEDSESFRSELESLLAKYRKYYSKNNLPYGLGTEDSAIEFLNEFMSNGYFRQELKYRKNSAFKSLVNYILGAIKKFLGKKLNFQQDLIDLENSIYILLDSVNLGDVEHYSSDNFAINDYNKLDPDALAAVNNTYTRIQKGLKDRLNAVKRYSNKNPKLWNQLLSIIQKLANSEAEEGIVLFMEHIDESILDSIKFLSKPIASINAKLIRQLSQDYVGFYKPLIDNVVFLMDTTDIFKDTPNYTEILKQLLKVLRALTEVNNKFVNVLKHKGYGFLRTYLSEQGMPDSMIEGAINWLDDPKHDSSIVMNWFGMSTNSDNAVQLTIAKMLNDVKNATERDTMEVGIRLTDTLNKAKEKYGNDIQKLLYERLDDGSYSGLRVKPLKWGLMRANQKAFLEATAAKLGIQKDENNQYVIPLDEDILNKWFDAINKWYADNADRKYSPEYYSLRNKMLSMKTRDAINEVQLYIDSILSSITINGVQYDNLLTDAEHKQLEQLRRNKKLLANKYNLDGSEKTGDDLIIAEELSAFNEEVSKNVKYEVDKKRYQEDRDKVIAKYGAGSTEFILWDERNTALRYTQEFYDRIDRLDSTIRDLLTEEHKDLKQKRRTLIQLFKDSKTGKVDIDSLTESDRRNLLQLDLDIANTYTFPTEEVSPGSKLSDFAEVALTDRYHKDAEIARNAGTDAYNDWYNKNHYEDLRGYMLAAYYYTELRPKEKFMDYYSEVVPIGRYTKLDPSSNWANHNWDESGPAILPNWKKYDNSKAYNEMADKPEVKALYDAIENIMNEASSFVSFMQFANDSRMPLIPARFMLALSRKDGILAKIGYAFEDLATTKEDDLDFVEEFSTMPNGDPIKVIPTRFIRMLEDTNTISTDAVASVVQYYNMAVNYKNMSEKLDDIEMMLNLLKQIQIRTKRELKTPGSTNVYKQSQLLVDRIMYGRNKTPITYNAFGKEINVSKTLDIVRGFVTKVNLSGNLWSIGTSFFTDATYTTLEAKMGRYFDLEDLNFAISEFYREFPNMMANIGNPVPNGKLPYLMMLNQVVKDNKELFDRLDLSLVLRSLNLNFWFAGYTLADYTVKSHTLLSIYHNYRFVNGEGFLSKKEYIDKFYPSDRKKGAVAFKLIKFTLYDAYIVDDKGNTTVNPKYSSYINLKLLNNVKNRINILSKRIDGTMREVDKAGVHANAIASYLVLHRNFMVSALHDRFKKKQFNLDLGAIEEGYYRSTGKFLKNIIADRHFSITQLLADYDNMQEYEQYAVRRTLNELVLIAASTAVAMTIASIVDGDDDYNNWLMLSVTYLAMRSAFEFRTMYNPFEFIALVKSPTAAFNWLDNVSSFINLVNPAAYVGDRTPFTIIDRGVYKGMPVILKNIIKVTPFKSVFEAQDPKSKRNYLLNQLMNF